MTRDEFMDAVGQGVHTGLRKAAEGPESTTAWEAIGNMPNDQWNAVLRFVADGFEVMGLLTFDTDKESTTS